MGQLSSDYVADAECLTDDDCSLTDNDFSWIDDVSDSDTLGCLTTATALHWYWTTGLDDLL